MKMWKQCWLYLMSLIGVEELVNSAIIALCHRRRGSCLQNFGVGQRFLLLLREIHLGNDYISPSHTSGATNDDWKLQTLPWYTIGLRRLTRHWALMRFDYSRAERRETNINQLASWKHHLCIRTTGGCGSDYGSDNRHRRKPSGLRTLRIQTAGSA